MTHVQAKYAVIKWLEKTPSPTYLKSLAQWIDTETLVSWFIVEVCHADWKEVRDKISDEDKARQLEQWFTKISSQNIL